MAEIIKTEKATKILLALLGLIIAVIYILVSWGKATWTQYIGLVASGFLALFLLIEGGIFEYFRKKDFKKLGFGDFIAWGTFGVGFLMLASFLLLIQVVQNTAPEWLTTFMAGYGTVIGILAGLLFIYHLFSPRPR